MNDLKCGYIETPQNFKKVSNIIISVSLLRIMLLLQILMSVMMRMVIVIKLVLMKKVHIIVNVYQDTYLMKMSWDVQVS